MATIIPAEVMGISSYIGKIAEGYNANMVAINLKNYACKVV